MPLERPEPGWVWLHVPVQEPVEVVVCSDISTWWAHFVRVSGSRKPRAVRCWAADGGECAWCQAEVGRRARYVFAVRLGDGALRLVELGRVQFPMLQVLYEEGRWIGRRLKLSREWAAANARIDVTSLGREVITSESMVELAEFVGTLGAVEARTLTPPPRPEGAAPSKGSATPVGPPRGVTNRWSERSR